MSTPPPPPSGAPGPTEAKLRSINCTQCGAPLSLHGGHRVRSITCSYCGSELDAKAEYKVVRQFTDRHRPPCPFELGMTGTLKDVEFTVIGLVQYETTDRYRWVELALFSPTHGYAWLEQVDNHYVFSRRVRDLPRGRVSHRVKSTFEVRGRKFRVFESYRASVVYVEGELTFVAEVGDSVSVIDAIAPPYIYSVERTGSEEEYVLGEYIEAEEAFRTFGLANVPARRHTVHPAQPFRTSAWSSGLSRAALYFVPVVGLLLVAVLVLGPGRTLVQTRFNQDIYAGGVESPAFEVRDADKLLALEMYAPVRNAWGAYDITVRKDGAPVFSMAKQISYYSGYDGGEHWSEGSQRAKAYFKVPAPGRYTVGLAGEGGAGGSGRAPPRVDVQVTVSEGIIVSRYFLGLLILCLLAAAWRYLARWYFESKRWKGGDDD